jgi:hypothetical protein
MHGVVKFIGSSQALALLSTCNIISYSTEAELHALNAQHCILATTTFTITHTYRHQAQPTALSSHKSV